MGMFDQSCVWHSFPSYHTNLFSPFLSSFPGKIHYCFRAAGVKLCGFSNGLTVWLVFAVVAGYRILICFFVLILVFWVCFFCLFVSQPQYVLKELCCCVHSWMPSHHVGIGTFVEFKLVRWIAMLFEEN